MSLSEDVRGELAAIDPRKPCCRMAELSALVARRRERPPARRAAGSACTWSWAARRSRGARSALLHGYGVPCEIRTYRRHAFEQATRFQIHLEDDAALGAGAERGGDPRRAASRRSSARRARVVGRSCCRAAYLRGAFLAAGSVSRARATRISSCARNDVEGAELLAGAGREGGLPARRRRAARPRVRLREGQRDDRGAARLPGRVRRGAALRRAGGRVGARRPARTASRTPTTRTCALERGPPRPSSARSSGSASRARFDQIEPKLREVAELRSRHPTSSLRELAGRCRPPATKAAVQRRLMKLRRLADGL